MDSYTDVALFGCMNIIDKLQQGKQLTESEKEFITKIKNYLNK